LIDAASLLPMAAGGGTLAMTNEYLSTMGSSGDDVRPLIQQNSRALSNVFGLPSTIVSKASGTRTVGKTKEEEQKKEEDTGKKKSLFEKMKEGFGKFMELLGKKINDTDPGNGPGPGGGGGGGNLIPGDAPEEIKALMSTISGGEGGPTSVQGIGAVEGLDNMTIDDAITKAKSFIGKGSSTGALGAFQFHSSYLRERAVQAGLDPTKDKFSMENQTKIMRNFMTEVYTAGGGQGGEAGMLKALKEGKIESEIFPKLSKDLGWPSLPGGSQPNVHTPEAAKRYQQFLSKYQQQKPKPATPVAGTRPGATALERADPSKSLSPEQHKAQQQAIREADSKGLTGTARAEYIAQKVEAVMSPIFQRPAKPSGMDQLSSTSSSNKSMIVALNTPATSQTSTAGTAPQSNAETATVGRGSNPLQGSGLYIG